MHENNFRLISPNDEMTHGGVEQYFHTGQEGLRLCRLALEGRAPLKILDFPSGHGRVLRWFRREWPEAEIHAVEVDADALAFVAQTFGAHEIVSTPALDMPLPGDVDLIFSGSLLTHFDEGQIVTFLERCVDALSPTGSLVFTAHGRIAALLAAKSDPIYGTLVDTVDLYREYAETGFAYRNYDPAYPTYGLTLSSPAWMVSKITALPLSRLGMVSEGGWGHQDVYIVRKNPWPMLLPQG